ncbi:hypothetical protein ACJMK2_041440 [Sinanodonta woodiana]|uniref:2'-5'-oligoadenylate synthetase 1 domain-containing protein n=1 Tax=Sinanodonta woodiana TaxID=1069815 RepID=A0ABD3W466_SINWO
MATGGGLLRTLDPYENLDIFDAQNLQMNDSYRASCNAVIDRLVKFLQNNVQLKVKEVVKTESVGILSLIVSLHDAWKNCNLLDDLYLYLSSHITQRTMHRPSAVYDEMLKSEDLRPYYSASLVKLQLKFVKVLPAKVMSLIRLVKHWRKSELPSGSGVGRWPTSYILELIVIRKWEDAGRPERFDLKRGLHSFLQALVNYRDLKVVWDQNYNRLYTQHRPPYVIDPANPFNNVMDRCDVWDDVAQYARKTLKWSLFQGLKSTETSRAW